MYDVWLLLMSGVYQSLTAGWWVSRQDVDEAVNNVCEELAPIEVDITHFVLSSCRLTHQMLDIRALRQAMPPYDSASQSPLTALSYCDDEHDTHEAATKYERFVCKHNHLDSCFFSGLSMLASNTS